MENFIKHHIGRTDLTGIRNCHIRGLHSIMLNDNHGNRVRMYIATEVDTYANYLADNKSLRGELGQRGTRDTPSYQLARENYRMRNSRYMTLGLHGHRTEVRLEVLCGTLYNIIATVAPTSSDIGRLFKYNYSSAIDGNGTRVMDHEQRYRVDDATATRMMYGDTVLMPASQLHTIHVDGYTAWLVYERGPSVDAPQEFFSYNTDIPVHTESDMYQPMTGPECQAMLAVVLGRVLRAKEIHIGAQENKKKQERGKALMDSVKEVLNNADHSFTYGRRMTSIQRHVASTIMCANSSTVNARVFDVADDNIYQAWKSYLTRRIAAGYETLSETAFADFTLRNYGSRLRQAEADEQAVPTAPVLNSAAPTVVQTPVREGMSFAEAALRTRDTVTSYFDHTVPSITATSATPF